LVIPYLLVGITLKEIGRHYPQRDRSNQQVKCKQRYVPKSNLVTREENVKLHTEVVNVVNIASGNDSKPSPLGGDVVASNMALIRKNLEGMPSLFDNSQQASPVQNIGRYNIFRLRVTWLTFLV